MKPTREQCLKWAEEVYGKSNWTEAQLIRLEALCQRVWNEAVEEAANAADKAYATAYVDEEIRKLKVTP